MAKGRKTGGRQKGAKNKKTRTAEETLARLGLDPLEGMALIALGRDTDGNPIDVSIELKAKMMSEVVQYILPKRKALEHSGPDGGPITASWLAPLVK